MSEVNNKISWMNATVRCVADMVSYCPAFWDICNLPYANPATDYMTVQPLARQRTKESNVMHFVGEAEAENETIPAGRKLKPRKRKTRQDWIDERPLATVMHDTEAFEISAVSTGVFFPRGVIGLVVEKNVLDEHGKIIGDGDMPLEELSNEWLNQLSLLQTQLHEISSQNRIPETEIIFPDNYVFIERSNFGVEPQYSGLDVNRIYGAHFIGSLQLLYGNKT